MKKSIYGLVGPPLSLPSKLIGFVVKQYGEAEETYEKGQYVAGRRDDEADDNDRGGRGWQRNLYQGDKRKWL